MEVIYATLVFGIVVPLVLFGGALLVHTLILHVLLLWERTRCPVRDKRHKKRP
jgi:hypothetical protein